MRPSRPRLLAGIACASLAALGVAGCGGGETTTVTTSAPATATTPTLTTPTVSTPTVTVPTDVSTSLDTTSVDTTTSADTTSSVDTTSLGDVAQYLQDVQAASNALTAFGTALRNIGNPQQLESQYASLTAQLDKFDAAIARMDGYTLDQAQLEQQRSRLVAAGPKLSDVLRRFLDAAQESIDTNNPAPVQRILPEVAREIQNFVQAAQPTP